jgi:hypothetical protein
MDNQNLFSQTYDQIVKQLLGSGSNNFQMLGNPQSFNWPEAPPGQLSPQAYQLMSAAPTYSPIAEFGGVGLSTLFDNYRQIFAHVGFKTSPDIEKQSYDLSQQAARVQKDQSDTISAANSAYQTAKQNGGDFFTNQYPTFKDWFQGPGSTYQSKLDQLKDTATRIFSQVQQINRANQPTSLQDALDLMQLPSGAPSGGNVPRGWAVVPDGAGVVRWQPAFTIATTSGSWRTQLADGTIGSKTINLDASKSDDSINKSWAGGNVSYGNPFWGINAGGSWSETNITKSDNSVKVAIELKSATNVSITPGAWYDGGFLKQLVKAGPDGTGYKILPPYTASGGDHPLFGHDGLCSTMVNGLVVAYKPSFRVTMQSSTFKSFEQEIKASAGFRIGPFSFGGDGGHYQKDVATTGNTTTFSGGSTSEDPVIIGVTVGFPGTEKP